MNFTLINQKYLIIIGFIVITLAIIHLYGQHIELLTNYNKLYKKYDTLSKDQELLRTDIFLLQQSKNAKPTETLYEMSYNSNEETPIQCIEVKHDILDTVPESVNVDVSGVLTKLQESDSNDILEVLSINEIKENEIQENKDSKENKNNKKKNKKEQNNKQNIDDKKNKKKSKNKNK